MKQSKFLIAVDLKKLNSREAHKASAKIRSILELQHSNKNETAVFLPKSKVYVACALTSKTGSQLLSIKGVNTTPFKSPIGLRP